MFDVHDHLEGIEGQSKERRIRGQGLAFLGRDIIIFKQILFIRGVAQSGSVPEWGSGGRWFKSNRPDHYNQLRGKDLRDLASLLFMVSR